MAPVSSISSVSSVSSVWSSDPSMRGSHFVHPPVRTDNSVQTVVTPTGDVQQVRVMSTGEIRK